MRKLLPFLFGAFACVISQTSVAQDARVCREAKNHREALTACDAALAETHNSEEVRGELFFYRGFRRVILGQNAGAVEDLTQAITSAPSQFLFPAYTNRALAYRAEKNDVLALADLTKALEIKPDSIITLVDRAAVETELRQFSAAAADSDKAMTLEPDGLASSAAGCSMRALSGDDLDMALTDCNRAIAIDPGYPLPLINRGLIYWRKGDYARAIADESDVIAIFPKKASALYIRGLARMKSGDAAAGKADVDAATAVQVDVAQQYAKFGVAP